MPRNTAKCRRNVKGSRSNVVQKAEDKLSNNMAPKENKETRRRVTVKTELLSAIEPITEPVHQKGYRKSERRRVARDIFLVFEEQPNTRRARGSNKKQPKPKFGHLKVEETVKSNTLLRDIKNEPKCYLGENTVHHQIDKKDAKNKVTNAIANTQLKIWSSASSKTHCSVYSSIASREHTNLSQETSPENVSQVAKVNPIFLWAKQDNTRIIEVRCEDYDKRNRIRITKTSNGWRAMPRSDPSSSKVLKLYTTPLVKVKHEAPIQANTNISQSNTTICADAISDSKPVVVESEILKQSMALDPIDIGIQVNGIDCSIKQPPKKSKKKKTRKRKRVFTCKKATIKINVTGVEESNLEKINFTENSTLEPLICQKGDISSEHNLGKTCEPFSESFPEKSCLNVTKINTDVDDSAPKSCLSTIKETFAAEHLAYPNESNDENSLQLCPKTGLFLRNVPSHDNIVEIMEDNHDRETLSRKIISIDTKPNSADDNNESLEAKTRNLKDLLDDADLFQHCDDNANCDADLIDTLVKSSCENNLIQTNEHSEKEMIENTHIKNIDTVGDNMLVVNEPPKCLSFNEAGEIEALNCELFHPNDEFIDSFVEKQRSKAICGVGLSSNNKSVVTMVQSLDIQHSPVIEDISGISEDKGIQDNHGGIHIIEESPKDLSYKKREEVCPPSESRSQCAVTSSSDVVKSQNMDESSALATSSETLKNLILEQFMKLNTMSGQKHSGGVKQLDDPHLSSSCSKGNMSSDIIETVVIEDSDSANEDNQIDRCEEPLKKRLRASALPAAKVANDEFVKSKLAMIDKDPDPLTQLRLLIRNSQWKVPDPILVPKDRLSAVLASPAREIPLLITTRPELRLPEAFAYPEIIQNPNILVISMAQLEAILKNNIETDTRKSKDLGSKSSSQIFPQSIGKHTKLVADFVEENQAQIATNMISQRYGNEEKILRKTKSSETTSKEESAKLAHNESSLSTDINAATMAVLNQMLWLPYFGQMSQDFINSVKTPQLYTQSAHPLPSKTNNVNTESCNAIRSQQTKTAATRDSQNSNGIFLNTGLTSLFKQGQVDDLNLFQKIVQHQMQNVINLTQVKNSTSTEAGANATAVPNNAFINEQSSHAGLAVHSLLNTEKNYSNILAAPQIKLKNVGQNNLGDSTKTYNLRSSVASRLSSDYNQFSNSKRPNLDNKPRLTCKSLSNLIDPEHKQPTNMTASSSLIAPCVLSADPNFQQTNNDIKDQSAENNMLGVSCPPVPDHFSNTLRVHSSDSTRNVDSLNDHNKQSSKIVDNVLVDNVSRSGDSVSLSNETNIPLWHPLFGSNSKSVSYSSPWQWTTVTAAGE